MTARHLRAPAVTLVVLAITLAAAAPATAAPRTIPRGWLGVVADGPLTTPGASRDGEWDLMARSGAESIRTAMYWDDAQPHQTAAAVPPQDAARFRPAPDGVPTDFTATDAVVAAAARRGIEVVPVVQRTPRWAAQTPGAAGSPPRSPATYGAFLTALVARYGPAGSLWAERPELPRVPIRDWQVWNEPSLPSYWRTQPFAPSFVALLRTARRALRAADPGARVVLPGLPNKSWEALSDLYRAGARPEFDVAAVHPYTGPPRFVARIIRRNRLVMRAHGDAAKPLWVTELSWPATEGRTRTPPTFETSDRGQALRLGEAVRRLARARRTHRIGRVFWYTWLSNDRQAKSQFDYSGLRRLRGDEVVSVPALAAFQRVASELEGCVKTSDARRCR